MPRSWCVFLSEDFCWKSRSLWWWDPRQSYKLEYEMDWCFGFLENVRDCIYNWGVSHLTIKTVSRHESVQWEKQSWFSLQELWKSKQWLMNCSVKAVLGELSESCWNPEIPVSESVQIDKATLAIFFSSQAQRGPSSPCKWQQPAQKVIWTCTKIAYYIHPRKLTWNPKMWIWMMMFLFERLIFRFHVAMLVFYNIKFMKIPRCFFSFTTPRSTPVRAAETW